MPRFRIPLAVSGISLLLAQMLLLLPLPAAAASCPSAPSGTAEYRQGFNTGCPEGLVKNYYENSQYTLYVCGSGNNPYSSGGQANDWRNGCLDGYEAGLKAVEQEQQSQDAVLASRNTTLERVYAICQAYTNEASTPILNSSGAFVNDPLSPGSEQTRYKDGCVSGYIDQVVSNKAPTQLTYPGNDVIYNKGYLVGFNRAYEDGRGGIPLVSVTLTDEMRTLLASIKPASCGNLSTMPNQVMKDGYLIGCYDGYQFAATSPNDKAPIIDCDTAAQSIRNLPVNEGYKQLDYNSGYGSGCRDGYSIGFAAWNCKRTDAARVTGECPGTTPVSTGGTTSPNAGNTTGKGIVPNCDPGLAPNAKPPYPNGQPPCDVTALVKLVKNIIKYLMLIVIPIAMFGIGWGGFNIMTAAGSEEKLSKGRQAITLAVTGVVIVLLSYLIVKLIFDVLGVGSTFRPTGI